jgi:hypothetical protein
MFGIKKLQHDINIIKEDIKYLKQRTDVMDKDDKYFYSRVLDENGKIKIDLSRINNRFHELGEKFDKNQEDIAEVVKLSISSATNHQALLDKIVTDDAIMQHLKDLNEKMTFLFDYMKQLEKLLSNVELIVDKCLPEQTLKLPKKKKATTAAS